jgi:hypothetical protein
MKPACSLLPHPKVAFGLRAWWLRPDNKKSPGARLARAACRSFGEYAFLEDSRYTSQVEMCGAAE